MRMAYEWDENKREANKIKHGLDFVFVSSIFADPKRVDVVDNRKNYGEVRIRSIGMSNEEVLVTVIHTDRNGITRIISVRRANKKERMIYYGNR
ncbi:hypothetical protein AGMMS4956_15710 [Bacteroidia bacterium]|nr:hypothetical protein AGMMS4956_15710 [Bacteroidia bacterium]